MQLNTPLHFFLLRPRLKLFGLLGKLFGDWLNWARLWEITFEVVRHVLLSIWWYCVRGNALSGILCPHLVTDFTISGEASHMEKLRKLTHILHYQDK